MKIKSIILLVMCMGLLAYVGTSLVGCITADEVLSNIPGTPQYDKKKANERLREERIKQEQRAREEEYRRRQEEIAKEREQRELERQQQEKELARQKQKQRELQDYIINKQIELSRYETEAKQIPIKQFDNFSYIGEAGYPFDIYWKDGIGCKHQNPTWIIQENYKLDQFEGIYDDPVTQLRFRFKKWNDHGYHGHDIGYLHYDNGIYGRYWVYVKQGTLTDYMIVAYVNKDGSPYGENQKFIPMFLRLEKDEHGFLMQIPKGAAWSPRDSTGGLFKCSPWVIMPADPAHDLVATPVDGTCERFIDGEGAYSKCSGGITSSFEDSERCTYAHITGLDEYMQQVIDIARTYMDKHWVYETPDWDQVKDKMAQDEAAVMKKLDEQEKERKEKEQLAEQQRIEEEQRLAEQRKQEEIEYQRKQEFLRQREEENYRREQKRQEAEKPQSSTTGSMYVEEGTGGCNVRIDNQTGYELEIDVNGVRKGNIPPRRVAVIEHINCDGVMVNYWVRGSVTGHNSHAFYPHERRGDTYHLTLRYK